MQVFGPGTPKQVGYIIAEPGTKTGNKTEAIDTATPLADSLGLTLDTSWYALLSARERKILTSMYP